MATDCRKCKHYSPPGFHGRGYCMVFEMTITNVAMRTCEAYEGPKEDEDTDAEESE